MCILHIHCNKIITIYILLILQFIIKILVISLCKHLLFLFENPDVFEL